MSTESLDALVLGGGGPVGASWMSALLHGLASTGVPVADADVVLGTSAGAVVGSWLVMQPDGLPTVPGRMRERAAWHAANARSGHTDARPVERATGTSTPLFASAAAVSMPPISADEADAMWRGYLPEGPWAANLGITSVNTETGLARVWSAGDDISVPVAVACSTAAPGVAPPVVVAGSVWVDGGVRSSVNADLILQTRVADRAAARHARPGKVLMLVPLPGPNVAREEAALVEHGYAVRVIAANRFYTKPADLLDVDFIDVAAAAGASHAHDLAASLASWLGD